MTQGDGSLYCKSCVAGWQTRETYCDELPDPQNCAEVQNANPKLCLSCLEGYDQLEDARDDENC